MSVVDLDLVYDPADRWGRVPSEPGRPAREVDRARQEHVPVLRGADVAPRYVATIRSCGHGTECWRMTCANGRYGWTLMFWFSVVAGSYVWLGLAVGFIEG